MRRRAMGQETEYGCVIYVDGRTSYPDEHLKRLVAMAQGNRPSQYYPNGHRMYPDIGSHLEIATGECDDPQELAHHVLAGDRNLARWVTMLEERYHRDGKAISPRFFKNNICNYGGIAGELGFGAHENYQIDGSPVNFVTPLLAYLATRQIVLGAGRLNQVRGRPVFELAQRSEFITQESSSSTTTNRPLVNLRDEAHALDTKRLHLICGDNNILPQQTALKFAIMDVLLTMEEEQVLQPLHIGDVVQAVQIVSVDPLFPIALEDGSSRTALDIQRFYFDQAWKFVQSERDLSHRVGYIAGWGRHLDRLAESFDAEHHVGELCWATKEWHLRSFMARSPRASLAELRRRELAFHQVTGEGSRVLASVLRRYGRYDEAAVELARTTPPATTRAWARGQLAANPDVEVCKWDVFKVGGETFHLSDPLDPSLPAAAITKLAA